MLKEVIETNFGKPQAQQKSLKMDSILLNGNAVAMISPVN